jgi:LysR family transcriptional regulator, low CO2-responsive transcriptional regulator
MLGKVETSYKLPSNECVSMKNYLGDISKKDTLLKSVTLEQLRVFEAAARHCSFTKAAQELFITQPTVSMQIKHLTQALGTPLFDHVGKRVFLTQAGLEVLSTCKEIFYSLEKLEAVVCDLKGMKQGRLKIFCDLYPGVNISIEIANHKTLLSRLNDNLDDLYILSCLPDKTDIEATPFLDNPLVVVAACNHPLANRDYIPLACLAEEAFILREQGSGTRNVVQQFFKQNGIPINIKLELGSSETIEQAVLDGLGLSVLSLNSLNATEIGSRLAILNVEGFPIQQQLQIVFPKKKQLSITASTFMEYLIAEGLRYSKGESIPLLEVAGG